jgi:ATP-dependent DNA helicase RecG
MLSAIPFCRLTCCGQRCVRNLSRRVKITRYETREEDPERDHLATQVTIEGPSYQLIHETVKNVTDIMSGIDVWSTSGLKKLEYPPEAIWETIVNAVIHRDYSISDDI